MNKLFYKYGKPKFTMASDPRFHLKHDIEKIISMKVASWGDLIEKAHLTGIVTQKIAIAIAEEKRHPFYKSDYAKGGLIEDGVMYRVGER